GRGTEYYDMPLIRSVVHQAARSNYRFSSLVLGIVNSKPFQMNMKPQEAVLAQADTAAPKNVAPERSNQENR
ncbi:MAG TPA: DUF1585 domain-containing protein, partial [Bryobacteraceae bacterium]|nr:DUF1585 domain-containing protein [Bryobacteraceae bacterium]